MQNTEVCIVVPVFTQTADARRALLAHSSFDFCLYHGKSPVPASLWIAVRCATCTAVACRLMGPRSCLPSDLASAIIASIVSEKYLHTQQKILSPEASPKLKSYDNMVMRAVYELLCGCPRWSA